MSEATEIIPACEDEADWTSIRGKELLHKQINRQQTLISEPALIWTHTGEGIRIYELTHSQRGADGCGSALAEAALDAR